MKLETHDYESDTQRCFGLIVYNEDGRSLPKGFVSSLNAHAHIENGVEKSAWIELGVQSPTGDASDHHHFSFPCENFGQAEAIVRMGSEVLGRVIAERAKLVSA
jgi:hypothetical protein